jgi:hypothetical protein
MVRNPCQQRKRFICEPKRAGALVAALLQKAIFPGRDSPAYVQRIGHLALKGILPRELSGAVAYWV